jgi:hypothetical protein
MTDAPLRGRSHNSGGMTNDCALVCTAAPAAMQTSNGIVTEYFID